MGKHHSALRQPVLLDETQPITEYRYYDRYAIEIHARTLAHTYVLDHGDQMPDIEDDVDIKTRAYLLVAQENMVLSGGQCLTSDFCQYEGIFVETYLRETRKANGRRLQARRDARHLAMVAER